MQTYREEVDANLPGRSRCKLTGKGVDANLPVGVDANLRGRE